MDAIYAGSFDPPTMGHLWMIREGAKLFQKLFVAIGTNPSKKCDYSVEQRMAWLTEIVGKEIALKNVVVAKFDNLYLVNLAREVSATHILRGIRNAADYGYERAMRHLNEDLNPDVTTMFLMPPRHLSEISSSIVKGLIGPAGWQDVVAKYLPECVFRTITSQ